MMSELIPGVTCCPRCYAPKCGEVDGQSYFDCQTPKGQTADYTPMCNSRRAKLLERALQIAMQNEVNNRKDAEGGCYCNADFLVEMWIEEAAEQEANL